MAKLSHLCSILAGLTFTTPVHSHDIYNDYLSLLGFTLEKANLIQIREALGNTPIFHSGDAGDSYYALCYFSKAHNATVIFESGEMGGKTHDLLSFVIQSGIDKSRPCGVLSDINTNLSVGPLSLNKRFDLVKNALPQPVIDISNGIQHKYHGKIPLSEQEIADTGIADLKYASWDVYIAIEVTQYNGVVSSYKVSKLTSW